MSASLPAGAAVVVLGPSGAALGRQVRDLLPGAQLHGPRAYPGEWDEAYDRVAAHLAALFAAGRPIVGMCASGILVRALAPALDDKRAEPPVVALAEDGSVAVPLLGGHHGANALARALAEALGGVAAVTTAGDLRLGIALDEPPRGWRIADPERVKPVAAALLAGRPVALVEEAGGPSWLRSGNIAWAAVAETEVVVTDRATSRPGAALVYHPPVLAIGIGCERGCAAEEIAALARECLAEAGLAADAVAAVASVELKLDEPGIHALAQALGVSARFFSAARLLAETPRLTMRSQAAFRATGCWGVAEGAALAAVASAGALVVSRRQSRRATCAIGRSPAPLDAETIGRPRGHLAVIGIGPGDSAWRTPEASSALANATDIVGYRLYLDLLGAALAGKVRHDGELGAEAERVGLALDLAAAGRRAALVSSGDAGVYGLAALVFERLDREGRRDWSAVEIVVCPGVSAMHAAAARLGAPLGHDFCAISLSDLMTPWAVIRTRLEAAAAADFVIVLYNPRSARRPARLAEAAAILLAHRLPETPVAIARNLGRHGEAARILPLGELAEAEVDMLSIVLVGNRDTRRVAGNPSLLYTPRGYYGGAPGMIVHFIGAGPGAADLITVRGLRLIQRCPVCLYAGSLVPAEIVAAAPAGARVIDTAPLTLDQILAHIAEAHRAGLDVARVHSGDPSIYGAIAEQMRRLDALGIAYDVTPGVPAFAAAAAALRRELTLPGVAQSVVLTRTAIRSSAMPEGEALGHFAASGATLAIHLSIANLARVVRTLTPHYGGDCPAVVAYRIGWPDERLICGSLADIRERAKRAAITRTALILVGRALAGGGEDSRLYAADHHHLLRPRRPTPVSASPSRRA